MSAAAVAIEGHEDSCQEPLTERLSRAPLPAEEAIRHAIRIATSLRDLHAQGLIYGAVSSQLVMIAPGGAFLRSSGGLAQMGDSQVDVETFGSVLGDMVCRAEGQLDVIEQLAAISAQCCQEAPDMQQVLIGLRLLALRQRQSAGPVRPIEPANTAPTPKLLQWARLMLAPLAAWTK